MIYLFKTPVRSRFIYMEKTIGEMRVRTDFNVSASSIVDEIKQNAAKGIDNCELHKQNALNDPNKSQTQKEEAARLWEYAQSYLESYAMYAVKAATV